MASWVSLLPKAPQSERVDAYSEYLKNQALQRTRQQDQQYNQARIQEQQALAAQKQRVMQHQDVLDKAYSDPENVKINPDTGELVVNYARLKQAISSGGAGELLPGIDKERIATETAAHQAIDAKLKQKSSQADSLMRNISSLGADPPDWNNQGEVQRLGQRMIQAINTAQNEGAFDDPKEAAAWRQRAANPDPQLWGELQQHLKAAPNYLKVLDQMGKVNENTHNLRMRPLQERKEAADASTAEIKATEAGIDLGSRTVGAGVYPQNSDVGENAPQAANPYLAAPAAQAYGQPQAAPAPATGNVDPRTGQPYASPQVNTAPMSEDARAQGIRIPAPAAPNLEPRDPDWTPAKDAQWRAQRKDPNNRWVTQYMQGEWTQEKEDAIKRLRMNGAQQVAAEDREKAFDLRKTGTEMDNQEKTMKVVGKQAAIAASRGSGSYTRFYDSQPPEVQKLLDDPDKFDPKMTRRRAEMLGETTAQAEMDQDRHDKPVPVKKGGKTAGNGLSAANARVLQTRHDKLQIDEQATWKSVGEIGDILNTKPGEEFRDPKTGKNIEMDPVQRSHWQREYEAARVRATELQKQAKQIRGQLKTGEFGPGGHEQTSLPLDTASASSPAQKPSTQKPSGNTPEAPQQRISVTLPNGKTKVFPSQKALDDFSKEYGLSISHK